MFNQKCYIRNVISEMLYQKCYIRNVISEMQLMIALHEMIDKISSLL